MIVNIIVCARVQTFSRKEPSPGQGGRPELEILSFVLKLNYLPKLEEWVNHVLETPGHYVQVLRGPSQTATDDTGTRSNGTNACERAHQLPRFRF